MAGISIREIEKGRRLDQRTMRRGCKLFLLSMVFSLILLAGWGIRVWQSQKPGVEPEHLLSKNPAFPTSWDTGEIDVISMDWRESKMEIRIEPDARFYAMDSAMRIWTHNGIPSSSPDIIQEVFRYENPIKAAFFYRISRPEIAFSNTWPNFSNPANRSQRYPRNDFYQSEFADQNHVVCAMGEPGSCQIWFYWARYGQYLLSVMYIGPNQGMDTDLFSNVVMEIDRYVDNQLQQ